MKFLGIKSCDVYTRYRYSYGCKLSDIDNIAFKKFINSLNIYDGEINNFSMYCVDDYGNYYIFEINDIKYPAHILSDKKALNNAIFYIKSYLMENFGMKDILDVYYDGINLFCNTQRFIKEYL